MILAVSMFLGAANILSAQNLLPIPPALTGKIFDLKVQSGKKIFYDTTHTPTSGINGVWLGLTIIVNKDDSIILNVKNELTENTTMHWHGLHVAPKNDGGPHQIIEPGKTWSPTFKLRNNAGTFWYHPHGAGITEQQVSNGIAGMFIIRDTVQEIKLNLPRTYGVDDIPLIVQTKAFDNLKQLAIATNLDTAIFVNGVMKASLKTHAQVIRFRLLNGSSLRTFNFGFSNNQNFYQIATDGGLLESPITMNRLRLSPGERAEILVNYTKMEGTDVSLLSFSSELEDGIYGSKNIGKGKDTIPDYKANFLNGDDFNLLKIHVDYPFPNAVKNIPTSLTPITPYKIADATKNRTIIFDTIRLLAFDPPNRAEGPFGMNNKSFDIDSINEKINLNTTEIWTLINKTLVAHPFHIHDVQFNVIDKKGVPQKAWKDVVLVMPDDTVKFITRFADFADNMTPYMYHCHLLHHEDDGMMGSFLVRDTTVGIQQNIKENGVTIYPNPFTDELNINTTQNQKYSVAIYNLLGQKIYASSSTLNIKLETLNFPKGLYILELKSNQNITYKRIIKQ
ncbi:MAG: multicopper oxidase domain-containing protein [Bacteroidetes bacterium]|nr:multicopper oxidase domain-containing protein [Bacteroidota bacterium]